MPETMRVLAMTPSGAIDWIEVSREDWPRLYVAERQRADAENYRNARWGYNALSPDESKAKLQAYAAKQSKNTRDMLMGLLSA